MTGLSGSRALRRPRWIDVLAAVLVIHAILIQPNHPGAATLGALRLVPLELPVILVLLLLAPGLPLVRIAVSGFLTAMAVLKAADLAAYSIYDRAFNPVLDSHLAHAAWMLAKGSLGWPLALAAAAAVLGGVVLLAALTWWATGSIARVAPPPRLKAPLAALGLVALAVAVADLARGRSPVDPPGAAFTARLAGEHAVAIWRTRADLARFRTRAAEDRFAATPPSDLMPALAGVDILLVFVESYGRATLDNPRYEPTTRSRLAGIDTELAAAGLAARSAYLTSPVAGGQSWLAHATLLSGLWIDNQRRYAALLASPRRTLHHLAAAAGWRTVAVMPAITLAWPEAAYFGYQRVYAAADLGYAGPPFNWVTMPDQYTLAAFERLELATGDRPPVFAEIALISSHAPWTPIPPLIGWDEVGDGRIFAAWATSGEPPEVLWRDTDRVRDQFGKAIDYALQAVGSFAARRTARPTLLIVLGDHQPAGFVAETGANRDAPIHVIGPPELLARLDAWGWTPGMLPAGDAPAWPMDAFRDRFLDAFANAPTPRHGRLDHAAAPGGER